VRTLSAGLQAAQKATSARPYIQVQAVDRQANIRRLRWPSWYAGAEPDGPHAAAVPSDGSLNRFRVQTTTLYHQRVTTPTAASDYSLWTSLATVVSASPVAAMKTAATITVFYMTTATAIRYKESTDNGATWGAEQTLTTAPGTVTYLAAAAKDATTALLLIAVAATLYRSKRSASAWGPLDAWTNTVATINGLAAHYIGDWNIAITGTETTTNNPSVWAVLYGDGFGQTADTWSALLPITQAAASSNVAFSRPGLGRPDVHRLAYREAYTGSVAYSRMMTAHQPATANFGDNIWTEPAPVGVDSVEGLALAYGTTQAFLTSPSRVLNNTLIFTPLDLSDRLLRMDIRQGRLLHDAGTVELTNADGALNADQLGTGAYAQLRLGGQLNVSPGWQTTTGNQVSAGLRFWIDAIEHVRAAGTATVLLHLISLWGLLAKVRPNRPVQHPAGTKAINALISIIAARGGLEVASLSSSPAISSLKPAFTLRPGRSPVAALSDLLDLVEDEVRDAGEYLYLLWPASADASVYAYKDKGDAHLIQAARHVQRARPSHAMAHGVTPAGAAIYDEDIDPTAQAAFYHTTLADTQAIGTATEAGYVADALARQAAISGRADHLQAKPNVAQELWDVIDVTDAALGYAAAKRRVTALRFLYDRQANKYQMDLVTGDP